MVTPINTGRPCPPSRRQRTPW